MEALGKTVGQFVKKHPLYTVALAAITFILFVVATSLYSNAVVWNLNTSNGTAPGIAIGRGGTPSLTQTLRQYDGFQYTHIAQYGYTNVTYTAFLPLYPLTIRAVSHVLHITVDYAALAVSWLSLCAAAVVLYKWIKLELEGRGYKISPWLVLGLLAAFPTAGFFVLPYTESFFLLLNVSALYLFRRKHYLLAGVVAALASATRFQGILLVVYFAANFLFTGKKRDWKKLIPVVLGVLGLVAYMGWLSVSKYHDPLSFMTAEKYWGRFDSNIVANLIHSMRPLYLWFIPVALIGLWSVWQYLGLAYFIYSLAFFFMPIASGNLTSINRYLVSLLPMFLGLAIFAQEKVPKPIRLIYIGSSVFLLGWSILLFANGYWVA